MLKKIALASIFAVTSIVSFAPAPVNAKPVKSVAFDVGSPVVKGLCPSGNCGGR